MKYLKILFIIALPVMFLASCAPDDGIEDNPFVQESRVYFSQANASTLSEASSTASTGDGEVVATENFVRLELLRSGSDISSALTVNFTTSSVFASTTDFQNEGDDASSLVTLSAEGSVTFEAGSPTTSIVLTTENDLLSSGDKVVTITITGTSDSNTIIGFSESEPFNVATITIQDDDCPIDLANDWVGSYDVTEVFTDGINEGLTVGGVFGFSGVIATMEVDPSDPTGTTVFLGNDDDSGSPYFADGLTMVFNTCPQTVTLSTDAFFNPGYIIGGALIIMTPESAIFDPASTTVTIVGDLRNQGGSNFGEFTITLVRREE